MSSGKNTGFGLWLTRFAGYAAPALWGLGCASLVAAGFTTGALWLLVLLLLLMLTRIRNAFGFFSVIVVGMGILALSWWADANIRAFAAYTVAWFLLFGAIRPIVELQYQRATGQAQDSDADQLATRLVPGLFWVLVWLLLATCALWLGTDWMTASAGGIEHILSWRTLVSLFA